MLSWTITKNKVNFVLRKSTINVDGPSNLCTKIIPSAYGIRWQNQITKFLWEEETFSPQEEKVDHQSPCNFTSLVKLKAKTM